MNLIRIQPIVAARTRIAARRAIGMAVTSLALAGRAFAQTGVTARNATGAVIDEWTAYGHDAGGTRYSPLAQITRENVASLEEAWRFRTGDMVPGRFEDTPLFVDGTIYVATPLGRVIALDPVTGKERWAFDPHVNLEADYGDFATRGISTWVDSTRTAQAPCRRRLYIATIDSRLFALDAKTGQVCRDFGARGMVSLLAGVRNLPQLYQGEYEVTSPPAVASGLVIVGSAISDNQRTDAPSGVVRAYDVRTGALRWSWDPVPQSPNDPAYSTWQGPKGHTTGAANAWSIISVDASRGLVFVPTGSASPDFYGGERLGANRYANSVVALRAISGDVVWHFQVVHHDLWDFDVPAQPMLFTLRRDGREIPAVAVGTKMGHIFILDRVTGQPLFPVQERPVPGSDVPGEEASPTQPFPVTPLPIGGRRLTVDSAWGVTEADRAACRGWMGSLRYDGIFTPPSLRGSLMYPGNIGGATWTSMALDPTRGLLVVPTNELPFIIKLVPRDRLSEARRERPDAEVGRQNGTPYAMMRSAFLSPSGVPCIAPPWSTITAIDLATGNVKWRQPFGFLPQLARVDGSQRWGSIALGGVMVTGGGILFAAGSLDEHLWAYDVETGRELARLKLPAGGHALPMTYQGRDERQYVVIAAGGHDRLRTTLGDYVVAYALPGRRGAAPNTRSVPLAPQWTGELREPKRIPVSITLAVRGDSVRGAFRVAEPVVTGIVSGVRHGNTLSLRIAFEIPAKQCQGVIAGEADLANDGQLLEGAMRETGACTERQGSALTISLRPSRAASRKTKAAPSHGDDATADRVTMSANR